MCGSMVDIQFPAAEIRREQKIDRKKDSNHRAKIKWPLLHRADIIKQQILS